MVFMWTPVRGRLLLFVQKKPKGEKDAIKGHSREGKRLRILPGGPLQVCEFGLKSCYLKEICSSLRTERMVSSPSVDSGKALDAGLQECANTTPHAAALFPFSVSRCHGNLTWGYR